MENAIVTMIGKTAKRFASMAVGVSLLMANATVVAAPSAMNLEALAKVIGQSDTQAKRMIILFDEGSRGPLQTQLGLLGASTIHRYNILPAVAVTIQSDRIAKLLANVPHIQVFEDMEVHTFMDFSVPQIRADMVQAAGTTGAGVKVCVVDTGVDDSHPYLNDLVAEKDFVNNDNDAHDDNGHGTHVAGTVASTHATIKGVAPGASLMAAKVLNNQGSGTSSQVMAGIDWCVQNGAQIITMSLGGGGYTGACDGDALAMAANAAVNQGVTVTVASGNNGWTGKISSPGCASKVISVGAVNDSDVRASFSNGGSQLDVVAPGVSINSTYPGGGFKLLSGTSMATPHVAGLAALLLSVQPLSPADLHTLLRNTAKDLGTVGFDQGYGYGRIDAYAAYQAIGGGAPGSSSASSEQSSSQVSSAPQSSEPASSAPTSSEPASSAPASSSQASSAAPISSRAFFDDFQGSGDQWTNATNFRWFMETPAERQVPGHVSTNRVAHADNCDGECILLSQTIDLSGVISAAISFWRYVDDGIDNGEYLKVEIYNGSAWSTLATWSNGSGDDDTWRQQSYALAPAYLNANFRIRFIGKANMSSEEVEVDDIAVDVVR